MTVAFGLWSLELTPGREEIVIPPADIRITNVALGDTLVDPAGRSTIKLTYDPFSTNEDDEEEEDEEEDEEEEKTTVLCSLIAGKFEHTTTDIVLERNGGFTFTVVGKNPVYLSGNYIDQAPMDNPPYDESDLASDDEDDLDESSSEVDADSDDIIDVSRFEELDEEPPHKLKRGRESENTVDDSKAGKKNKKLKAENGQAVPADTREKEGAAEAKQEKKAEKKGEQKDEKKEKKKERKKEKKDESGEGKKPKPTEKELSGGVKILDSTVGTGAAAKKGNTVSMRYIGKLQNGKIFDRNVQGKPFTFRLGQGEVIKGWDEGIVGMHVGGERKLTIPPHMGYGKKGTDGIPPNSTLIFEVKLLEIK